MGGMYPDLPILMECTPLCNVNDNDMPLDARVSGMRDTCTCIGSRFAFGEAGNAFMCDSSAVSSYEQVIQEYV